MNSSDESSSNHPHIERNREHSASTRCNLSFALPELSCSGLHKGQPRGLRPLERQYRRLAERQDASSQHHSFESKWGRNRSQMLASLERPTRIPTVFTSESSAQN